MATSAHNEGHFNLATLLEAHAIDEKKHGRMLAAIADGERKIVPLKGGVGRWVKIQRLATGEIMERATPDPDAISRQITWDSVRFPGEQMQGYFENFDGLSQRYFSLWLLFGGRPAASFEWHDKLAFMCALEKGTQEFYRVFEQSITLESTKAIVASIIVDESKHSDYLYSCLRQFSDFPDADIMKWRFRLSVAFWGLLVDVWRFLIGHK